MYHLRVYRDATRLSSVASATARRNIRARTTPSYISHHISIHSGMLLVSKSPAHSIVPKRTAKHQNILHNITSHSRSHIIHAHTHTLTLTINACTTNVAPCVTFIRADLNTTYQQYLMSLIKIHEFIMQINQRVHTRDNLHLINAVCCLINIMRKCLMIQTKREKKEEEGRSAAMVRCSYGMPIWISGGGITTTHALLACVINK